MPRVRRLVLQRKGGRARGPIGLRKRPAPVNARARLEFDRLSDELKRYFLRVKVMSGDGNCLFRALCDQVLGHPNEHKWVRREVVNYIARHKAYFVPFLDDTRTFEQYLNYMRKDGVWGGNVELQAAALWLGVDIAVHQLSDVNEHTSDDDVKDAPQEVLRIETMNAAQVAEAEKENSDTQQKQLQHERDRKAKQQQTASDDKSAPPTAADSKSDAKTPTPPPAAAAASPNTTKRPAPVAAPAPAVGGGLVALTPLTAEAYWRESGRVLHVSYHGGEHYNSVRSSEDMTRDVHPSAMNWHGPLAFAAELDALVAAEGGGAATTNSTGGRRRKPLPLWRVRLNAFIWFVVLILVVGAVVSVVVLSTQSARDGRDNSSSARRRAAAAYDGGDFDD